jgi:peptidyl-Lys metalloendopeptidase
MKSFSPWLAASALMAMSASSVQVQAQAPGGLSVTLSSPASTQSAAHDVMVDVTMTNFSSEPVQVLRWYTPLEQASSGLFKVTRNGEVVDYVGALVKRGVPTAADYVTIAAGDSMTRPVKLSSLYDFSATGVYNVEYDVASMHTYRGKLPGTALSADASQRAAGQLQQLSSNTIAMTILGGSTVPAQDSLVARGYVSADFAATVTTIGCSAAQATAATTALRSAETYASESLAYLNAGTRGPRYTTWFGVFSASRYATVTTHFRNISSAASTRAIALDCSTCRSGPNANAFAYVFANQPYRIYLCNAFWSAPNTGTDSRAGTLVHELSHFTVLAGTNDRAYGQTAARRLATTNPAAAVANADNHEYFAENTPRQN